MTTTDYKREIIPFTTEADWLKARAKDITSTDSASLFGMGRHTYAELYYMKKEGVQVEFKENDSIKWGRRNEPLIAEGLAEDHKLTIRKYKDYVRIASLRIGSSFDYLVQRDGREVPFEIKSVKARFKKEWFDEYGDVQCPLHIEFQLEWEMLVFGSDICALGVKFDSDDAHLVWRKSNPDIRYMLLQRVKDFWDKVDKGESPAWDYTDPRDQDLLKQLNNSAKAGKVVDVSKDEKICQVINAYKTHKNASDAENKLSESFRANVNELVGDAETVIWSGGKFTLKEQFYGYWKPAKEQPEEDTNCLFLMNDKEKPYKIGIYVASDGAYISNEGVLFNVVAWMNFPEYKPQTKSRVLRFAKPTKAGKRTDFDFDAKTD